MTESSKRRIHHHRTALHHFDLDCYGHYPLSRLVMLYVEAAGEHADRLGIGEGQLVASDCTWILSRLSTLIHGPVDIHLPLDIETGLIRFDGITSLRALRTTQEDGAGRRRPVATTLTRWAAMGLESRRPVPLERITRGRTFDFLSEEEWSLPTLPRRVIPEETPLERAGAHRMSYSDLDFNRHFNSSAWIATALDALPMEQLRRLPLRVDLHFIREAVHGDRLTILSAADGTRGVQYVRLSYLEEETERPAFDLRLTY